MKNNSPNKFLGGIVASAIGRKAQASGTFDRAKYERLAQMGGAFGEIGQSILDQNPIADPTPVAGAAPVAPTADMPAGATMGGGAMDPTNPFEGKTFKIEPASPMGMVDPELASTGIQPETTYEPPMQGNQMGSAKPLFNAAVQASAEAIYGTPMQRQMTMPQPPLFFKDQTGDGKITQADVIKARTEGYKE
jgi:hypothetical protein